MPPDAHIPSAPPEAMPPAPAPYEAARDAAPAPAVPWPEALRTFATLGAQSFGGPAAQIALMHRVFVDEKRWLSEARFLHALNFCMLLPGPEATQLCAYAGWLLRGWRGALVAGLLFITPGVLCMLALSIVYVSAGDVGWVRAAFGALQAAVLALVAQALVRLSKKVLCRPLAWALALGALLAMTLLRAPFPLVIGVAALVGLVASRAAPGALAPSAPRPDPAAPGATSASAAGLLDARALAPPSVARTLGTLALWAIIWLAPVALCALLLGPRHILTQQGVFFGQVALVTFGGAYSVLSYVAQHAVDVQRWLTPEQMATGLGLAESTPGPLIMVLQFVGFVSAHARAGGLDPLLAGVLASAVTTWAVFAPSFFLVIAGAPWSERLRSSRAVAGALAGVTPAVVGVIANLALYLALHTLWASAPHSSPPAGADFRGVWSVRWDMLAIALLAGVATFALRWGVGRTLLLALLAGLALHFART